MSRCKNRLDLTTRVTLVYLFYLKENMTDYFWKETVQESVYSCDSHNRILALNFATGISVNNYLRITVAPLDFPVATSAARYATEDLNSHVDCEIWSIFAASFEQSDTGLHPDRINSNGRYLRDIRVRSRGRAECVQQRGCKSKTSRCAIPR